MFITTLTSPLLNNYDQDMFYRQRHPDSIVDSPA